MDIVIEAVAVPVVDTSQPGEARRAATAMAKQLGFDEATLGGRGERAEDRRDRVR